ncbi:hypothetical protein [Microbacterium hibisci]|uniref:hypothetical protein n=1 Tax=Microbacterium hibisci TaxID=2036000 RepID=UPI001943E9B1|nr:hypothetical protein [Microbacterium hibisci]
MKTIAERSPTHIGRPIHAKVGSDRSNDVTAQSGTQRLQRLKRSNSRIGVAVEFDCGVADGDIDIDSSHDQRIDAMEDSVADASRRCLCCFSG